MTLVRFTTTETHESAAHKKSSHTARAAKRKALRTAPMEFVCIDGEGQTFDDGTHRYVLLGCGTEQISNHNGLSWEEIFSFLYRNFQSGGVAYTGFFLSYDFTQWLKGIAEYQARRLLDKKERAKRKRRIGHNGEPLEGEIYFPVDYKGWEFDILGTKRLKIRPVGVSRWMYICDTGGFFQKSFLKVIDPREWQEPVVTQEEYNTIEKGKDDRASAVLGPEMARYNMLENDAHARVLRELDKGLRGLGIHLSPKQWFGPGQAAQAWLDTKDVPTAKELSEIVPAWFLEACRASYYGGWFEIMAHGLIPGVTYEYDINSAYPWVISQLPCLRHGQYARGNGQPLSVSPSELCLVRATVWSSKSQSVPNGRNPYLGAMLHRDADGNISRPLRTEGWYWLDELYAAEKAGAIRGIQYHEWVRYLPCACPSPLQDVADIYALRLRVGKKTPLGIACKLVPNSLYGKFAQSVGNPKYGNPIYASRITSRCRTRILEAVATHPKGKSDVLMVATDGVYFRSPHTGLALSGNLGEWDAGEKNNLCLFKPGVYWDDMARQRILAGEAPVFKARGVNSRDFGKMLATVDDMFARLSDSRKLPVHPSEWPSVEFPLSFAMVTAIQAVARNKWDTAGTLVNEPTGKQSSNPVKKRSAWYWDGDVIRSKPPLNIPYEASHPYEKRFGMEDPFSDENNERYGISPDGLPGGLWKEAILGD